MTAHANPLRRMLARRRRGMISLVAVMAMVPVSLNYAASINNGQAVDDRVHVQDSADALTMMHSTWASRSMNVLSMNNVSATQALTVAIGSEALDGALQSLMYRSIAAIGIIARHSRKCKGYGLKPLIAWCVAEHVWYMRTAFSALAYVYRTYQKFAPRHGMAVAYRALRAIDAMNREIADRFPTATGDIADSYRQSFEIDTVHYADPCQGEGRGCQSRNSSDGMSLPLEEGGASARAEACLGMLRGTLGGRTTFEARGFPMGRGPVTYGGSESNPHVRDHINEVTNIGHRLERWWSYHDRLEMDKPWFDHDDFPSWANFQTRQEADGSNAFTDRFNAKLSDLCPGAVLDQSILLRFVFRLQAPVPEFWHPIGVPPIIPGPVTSDGLDEAFHALAYAEDDPNIRIGTSELTGSASVDHFGYGQSAAFNPDGASFFSQNWRPEMVPADRIDRASEAGSRLSWQAPAPFSPLAEVLRQVGSSQGVERINGH